MTKHEPFRNYIKYLYNDTKTTVLKRLAKFTCTTVTFETFYHYIKDYKCLSEKMFYKQFISVVTMLSTPTGILKICTFLNKHAITNW